MTIDDLTQVPNVGPATADKLRDAGIETIDDLAEAIETREPPNLIKIEGLGVKTIDKIEKGIERYQAGDTQPVPAQVALPIATRITERLRDHDVVARANIAGSLRRGADTVGDIDVLVATAGPDRATADANTVFDTIESWDAVADTIERGSTKLSVRIDRIQVDFRAVELSYYGAAMQYFTGSHEHNIALRRRAKEMGYKLSEYGLFEREIVGETDEKRLAGHAEKEIYDHLGLRYPDPAERDGDIDRLVVDDSDAE